MSANMTPVQWVQANPEKFKKYRGDLLANAQKPTKVDPARYCPFLSAQKAGICLKTVSRCMGRIKAHNRKAQTPGSSIRNILRNLMFRQLSSKLGDYPTSAWMVGAITDGLFFCTLNRAVMLAKETGTEPDLWLWGSREEKEAAIFNHLTGEVF